MLGLQVYVVENTTESWHDMLIAWLHCRNAVEIACIVKIAVDLGHSVALTAV
jgi:hypothetical protein